MPELPEIEALRRALDGHVRAASVERAEPAHVATLKTVDPPLATLVGRRLAGARRRGKHLLFPTEDEELVLHVHLMTAGRLVHVLPGRAEPSATAFRLTFTGGGALVLAERGSRKQARVGLYRPETLEAELARLGPEALGIGVARLEAVLRSEPRQLHALLRDQRALAGIGRAWANEILRAAHLSPYARSIDLGAAEIERLAAAIDRELERGLTLRERGLPDAKVYRVHGRAGQPCPECSTPLARVAFETHTIVYCPACQTGGRLLRDRRLSRLLRWPSAGPAGSVRRAWEPAALFPLAFPPWGSR